MNVQQFIVDEFKTLLAAKRELMSKRDYWIAQKLKAKKLMEKYDKEINLIHTRLDKLKEEWIWENKLKSLCF